MTNHHKQIEAALKKITGLDFHYHKNEISCYLWQAPNEVAFQDIRDAAQSYLDKSKIKRMLGESPITRAIKSVCKELNTSVFYEEPLSIVIPESLINPQEIIAAAELSSYPIFHNGKGNGNGKANGNGNGNGKVNGKVNGKKLSLFPSIWRRESQAIQYTTRHISGALSNILGLEFSYEEPNGLKQYTWQPASAREYREITKNAEAYLKKIGYELQKDELPIVAAIEKICDQLVSCVHDGYAMRSGNGHKYLPCIIIRACDINPDIVSFSQCYKEEPPLINGMEKQVRSLLAHSRAFRNGGKISF